jgi:NAD(P)H-dependent FMN reductase/ketosteroid isomerase-like protein
MVPLHIPANSLYPETMMAQSFDVAVLIGSLRKDSISRKAARALIALAPTPLKCELVEIGDLAIYDQDLDETPPAAWLAFRRRITKAHAVLFVTPEYNRSIPGCLKNALDVASRPEGKNAWDGKPAGIVSVTPYKLGGFGANHAIRQALVFLNIPAMQQPEAYIGGAAEIFGADGSVKNAETNALLAKFLSSFEEWVRALHNSSGQSFDEFLRARSDAASAYVRGDASPLDKLLPAEGNASFFPPRGGTVIGADAVKNRYDKDARSFGSAGESNLSTLQSAASGGLAFWSGIQEADVDLAGKKQSIRLRITEVFMRQEHAWKLIHRHADMSADPATT